MNAAMKLRIPTGARGDGEVAGTGGRFLDDKFPHFSTGDEVLDVMVETLTKQIRDIAHEAFG